jgi:DNA-binding response OmpR family regulator
VSNIGRVLVVEGDDDIRNVYALWLEEAGFEVIEARDGARRSSPRTLSNRRRCSGR